MLALALHARVGDRPGCGRQVDFASRHAADFARTGAGQDDKFQGPRRRGRALSQRGNEPRHVGVRHRGVMAAGELASLRQDGVKMTSPPGRVLAAAMTGRAGRVQHALDAAAQPPRRLGLGLPQRPQHQEDGRRVDPVDGHSPQCGGLRLKRLPPLPTVDGASPDPLAIGHVGQGGIREGHGSCRLRKWDGALRNGIEAGRDFGANLGCDLSRPCQRDGGDRPAAHLTAPAADRVEDHPSLGARRIDHEVEAASIAVATRLPGGLDRSCGQLVERPRHPIPLRVLLPTVDWNRPDWTVMDRLFYIREQRRLAFGVLSTAEWRRGRDSNPR